MASPLKIKFGIQLVNKDLELLPMLTIGVLLELLFLLISPKLKPFRMFRNGWDS